MGIHIPVGATIAGICALDVRDFLARTQFTEATLAKTILTAAGIQYPRAACTEAGLEWASLLLVRLEALGVVVRDEFGGWKVPWTSLGFLRAHQERRVPRAEAEMLLEGVLSRCEALQRKPRYPWRIREIQIFGSLMRREEIIGDIDLAGNVERRPGVTDAALKKFYIGKRRRDEWEFATQARLRDEAVQLVSKASKRVAMTEISEIETMKCDSAVIWRDGQRVAFEPVRRTRTEAQQKAFDEARAFNRMMQEYLERHVAPEHLRAPGGLAALLRGIQIQARNRENSKWKIAA